MQRNVEQFDSSSCASDISESFLFSNLFKAPIILTCYHAFIQSLQENSVGGNLNLAIPVLFHILSKLLFTIMLPCNAI